ncbi:FHA domain-containing protein [bacterium]|nr:FHA domain-containing protein [bacterium]
MIDMAKLIIRKEDKIVKKISVHSDVLAFTIGSEAGNDIVLKDASISYFHVQFERQDESYYVRDLQSEWGTFLNGRKISSRTLINDNDEIGIGNHNITFIATPLPANQSVDETTFSAAMQDLPAAQETDQVYPSLMNMDRWTKDKEPSTNKERDLIVGTNGNGNGNGAFSHTDEPPSSDYDNGHGGENASPYPTEDSLTYSESDFSFDSESCENSAELESEINTDSADGFGEQRQENTEHFLVGIYGYYYGRKFKISRPETRIGRNVKLNNIVVSKNSKGETDQSVSRRQATITYENGRYQLTDKRSKSRTVINRYQLDVDDKIDIYPGDEIEIMSDQKNHIFRMVEKGNWDFSFPKRTGDWHIRFRTVALNTYAVAFLTLMFILAGKALFTYSKASYQPNPLTVEASNWFSDTEKSGLIDAPYNSYPAIADINRDKIVDLIYIDEENVLKCIDGEVKEVLWQADDFKADASLPITVADINNDRRQDILVVSQDMRVRAIDGLWGIEIWQSPILAGPLTGAPVVTDFNQDGFEDVAIVSKSSAIYLGYSNYRTARWVTLSTDESLRSISASTEFNGDKTPRLFVGTESGKVLIVDGVGPKVISRIDINEELSKADGNYFQDQIEYPVAVTDLNGDNSHDVVVYTAQNNVIVFHGESFDRLWFSAESEAFEEGTLSQQMALGDLDGDKLPDLVLLSPRGRLRALKGTGDRHGRGLELWAIPTPRHSYTLASLSLADFNNNGTQDVLVTTDTGSIQIREGMTGETIWQGSTEVPSLIGAPVIGDLDHNNQLDIVHLSGNGELYKLQTNRFISKDAIVWGQPHGNNRRSNYSNYREQYGSISYAYVGPLFVISLSVIGLHMLSGIKRKKLGRLEIL